MSVKMHPCVLEKLWCHQAAFLLDAWLSLWPRPGGRFGSVQFHICAVTHWRIIKWDLFSLRWFPFYIKSFRHTPIKDTQLGLIRTKTVWQAFCRFITAFYSLHVWCTLSEVLWAHFETSCDQLAKSKLKLWQYRKKVKYADTRFNHILFVDSRTHLKDVKTFLTFYAFTFTTLMTKSQTVGQILVFKRASQLFLAHLVNFFVSEHQYSGAARHGLLLRCLRAKFCKFRVLFPSSWLK